MPETFTITAIYKNQERDFEASFNAVGFSYRIEVLIDGVPVVYEPDEERNFRARLGDAFSTDQRPDALLLKAVAEALEKAFR